MLSLLLAMAPKRSARQSTTILRLPTPRNPPKSITAARTKPSRSTMTSTMRPMFSSAALPTSRPRMPCASRAPITVTDAGGFGSFAASCFGTSCAVLRPDVSLCAHAPMDVASATANAATNHLARISNSPHFETNRAGSMRQHDRHLDLAARAQHLERDLPVMAAKPQVDAGCAELEVAQHHLMQEFRQLRIAQADFAARRVKLQAKGCFQHGECRAARPGLRRAGDRIKHGTALALAPEAAEQFGQPPQIHIARGIEHAVEQVGHRVLQAVAGEPKRNQRIVVRPDRAVVVGHRIVTGFADRDGADAPARVEALAHQIGGNAARTILAHDPGEEKLSGIGGSHPALRLVAIERERVGAELLAPERRLEL